MKFTIKQRIMTFGKQYRAFDESENQVYEIRSMILSPERRKEVYDMAGNLRAWCQWPVMSGQAELVADDSRGELEIPYMSMTPQWEGTCSGQPLQVSGDFFRRNFTITVGNRDAAIICKRFLSFSDTYEIDVDPSAVLPEFVLLIAAVIDHKYHSDKS